METKPGHCAYFIDDTIASWPDKESKRLGHWYIVTRYTRVTDGPGRALFGSATVKCVNMNDVVWC